MEKLKNTEYRPFDRSTCQDIVRTVFNKAEVNEVQMLTGGIVNANFDISLANPDTQMHLRVYRGEDAETRATKERLVYNLIAKQTDIPVPAVHIVDISRTNVDEVFALQSSLPGVNLETVCNELTDDEQRDIALQIGECLGQLHAICFTKFGDRVSGNAIGDKSSWREFFLEFTSKNISWCEEQGTIDNHLADSLRNYVTEWQWFLPEDQPAVLVHKDFHPGNIKVRKDQKGNWRISGVYDFEHAIAGHNEFDFAKPYWAFFEPYPQMREPMLSGYNSVNKLSPLFDLRINKLYRLVEITDFLVFGTKRGMNSEVARNISIVKEILGEAL
jgi:aminoglycoside phosphotransferase (APT) family kinase protein